jgi:predicted nucleotidyltransferase component of viral defense system
MAPKQDLLSSKQADFLRWSATQPALVSRYYLTGGTPLTAFYLHHRYSDDLDFFTQTEEVNLLSVQKIIKAAKEAFSLKNVAYQNFQGLHNFFLEYPDGETLKVDFCYYPFQRVQRGIKKLGIEVDSLLDIAINKIQSIGTRAKARDFVDLYFIAKEKDLIVSALMTAARNKFDFFIDPIQYGKQLLKVLEVKDFPRMVKPFDQKDFENFFLAEAGKLKREILE